MKAIFMSLATLYCFTTNFEVIHSDEYVDFEVFSRHYKMPEDYHYIVTDIFSYGYSEDLHVFIIKDMQTLKYNIYICNILSVLEYGFDVLYIVENFTPLTSEQALAQFPDKFDENSYGF